MREKARFSGSVFGGKRLWFEIFLLFACCVVAVSLVFFILSIGRPYMGTRLNLTDRGWEVRIIEAAGQARAAGINKGDRPVLVNGQSAESFLERYEKLGVVSGRLIEEMTVINDAGILKSVTTRNSPATRNQAVEVMTFFIVCLAFWVTGFYVFIKRPKNTAALLLCLCSLLFGLALSANMASQRGIPIAPYLEVTASSIGPWVLFHFFLVLPEERFKLRGGSRSVYLIYLPAAIIIILFPLVGYASGQATPGFRNIRLLEYGTGFLAAIGIVSFNYLATVSARTRQQMKIVMISGLAALLPFLFLSILPEAIWRQTIIPSEFSVLLLLFIPIGMGYAVLAKKLMDIDVVIRRGLIYGLITILMASILSIAIIVAADRRESLGFSEQVGLALVLGVLAAALFGPAKTGIEFMIDKLLYKDRYDYRQIIQNLSTSLKSVNSPINVSRLVVGAAALTLNLDGCGLFVKTQSGEYEAGAVQGIFVDTGRQYRILELISQRNGTIEFPNSASAVYSDISYLIPLLAGEKEVGILCLSQKASSQEFSSNDIYLLQGIASVGVIALQSSLLLRDVSVRDTFVSVASHELRTPLTSIVGYADLLLRRNPSDDTKKRWLKNILNASQRLSAIVDDLLNVSRIQSGRISIIPEKVELAVVLKEALCLAKEQSKKHKFILEIEPGLPDVVVDREKFGQVIGNLLSNAVKYSPKGGRITVLARREPEKHRVLVSIIDEGVGISPEDKNSLFTTFKRIQREETRGVRGSGLGLYISKEWIEAMDGKIWFESELNKGSTFFVEVPTKAPSEDRNESKVGRHGQ